MEEFNIPIFKKSYDLYRAMYSYRNTIPRQDRYALWQRCENIGLDVIKTILTASHTSKEAKLTVLEKASLKLNLLRVFIRLSKEIRIIDNKKYVLLQKDIDEIGRMLGGWIKSNKKDYQL